MADKDPNNAELSRVQAYALMGLGTAHLKLDRPREAMASFEEAFRRFNAFRVADAGDFEAPIAAVHALGQLSAALLAIGEPREALARLTVAEDLLSHQGPSADRDLPETHYYQGLVYLHGQDACATGCRRRTVGGIGAPTTGPSVVWTNHRGNETCVGGHGPRGTCETTLAGSRSPRPRNDLTSRPQCMTTAASVLQCDLCCGPRRGPVGIC